MFAGLKFLGTKIPEVSITHMTHLHNLLAATKRKHSLSMAHNILLQAGDVKMRTYGSSVHSATQSDHEGCFYHDSYQLNFLRSIITNHLGLHRKFVSPLKY